MCACAVARFENRDRALWTRSIENGYTNRDLSKFHRQLCVARTLSFGVAFPTQFLCVWSPFLFLLFLTLRLDEASAHRLPV